LGRFFVICFFIATVVTILGIYLISNLFQENQKFSPPEALNELASLGQKQDVKPSAANQQLRVYYSDDGTHLIPTLQPADLGSKFSRGRQAVEALFKRIPGGSLRSPVPEGVEVRGFYVESDPNGKNRTVVIDLSGDIQERPLGGIGAEMLCVYAIVNTALANTTDVEACRILIDGKPVDTLWGQVDISGALTPGALLK